MKRYIVRYRDVAGRVLREDRFWFRQPAARQVERDTARAREIGDQLGGRPLYLVELDRG